MTKIFIGGSRKVTRINELIRQFLDKVIDQKNSILIGDANGADKAIQKYLKIKGFQNVEVFCMEGNCRNNLGNWQLRIIPAKNRKRDFLYFSIKDQNMADEANIGFMVWDGKSLGTLLNVYRLIDQGKEVVIYTVPSRSFNTLKEKKDWEVLYSKCKDDLKDQISNYLNISIKNLSSRQQRNLFEIPSY